MKKSTFNEENIGSSQEAVTEKKTGAIKNLWERKISGAVKEIFRRKELDESVENNLSQGLETNPDFVAADRKIDRMRNWFSSKMGSLLDKKLEKTEITSTEITPYVFDEAAMQAMKELEEELTDPLAKKVYDKLADFNKELLLDHLVDNKISLEESRIIGLPTVSDANHNVVAFSDNGYLMQLSNKEEVRQDGAIDTESEKALYNLISPDGKVMAQGLSYDVALENLMTESSLYQESLKIEENTDNMEAKIDELMKETEEDERDVASDKEKENEFFDNFEKMPAAAEEIKPATVKEEAAETEMISSRETGPSLSQREDAVETESENQLEIEPAVIDKDSFKIELMTPDNIENKPELESTLLFTKYLVSKLKGISKDELASFLTSEEIKRNEVLCWDRQYITGYGVTSFSSVGYMILLTNREEVKVENGIDTTNDKANYTLMTPDGKIAREDLKYNEAQNLLQSESKVYLEKINEEFEANKEEFEKELNANQQESLSGEQSETKFETNTDIDTYIDPAIDKYAKSIGIKTEELANNQEFLSLSPEQQKFTLETLRRSSLARAKVEAHESFVQEKASKKWWQIGFSLNQNYHKERHKIEAVKNIESRGLEGYGETELAWLIDVVKNGPEVKMLMNDREEIIVNCLREDAFGNENKDLVAKYNEIAREYIEYKPKNNKNDKLQDIRLKLEHVRQDLMLKSTSESEAAMMNETLIKARSNAELLRFLSADKETEKILDKMASTSTSGFNKTVGMIGGQKDKLGYSALGFGLRTGAKFAIANSAYLASAISYSVAPVVATVIGGFRGYKIGEKDLKERAELAKLGVEDTSNTAKTMNLAKGRKIGQEGQDVNFGLTEKLQVLIDKINELKRNDASTEEINKTIDALSVRLDYTEKKINRGEVDYGSIKERNLNYFDLANTLAEAKTTIGVFSQDHYALNYHVSKDIKELTRYNKKTDFKRKKGETTEAYKQRMSKNKDFNKYKEWVTDEYRLAQLSQISVEDRLASFLNYKEEKQKKKEQDFLIKKAIKGAAIGGSFATAGVFVAEQLGINHWFTGKSDSTKLEAAGLAKKLVSNESAANHQAPVSSGTKAAEHVVSHHDSASSHQAISSRHPEVNSSRQPVEAPKNTESPETSEANLEVKPVENPDQTMEMPNTNTPEELKGVNIETTPASSDNPAELSHVTVETTPVSSDNLTDIHSATVEAAPVSSGTPEELKGVNIETVPASSGNPADIHGVTIETTPVSPNTSSAPDVVVEKISVSSEAVPVSDKGISSMIETPVDTPVNTPAEIENVTAIHEISNELHIKPESLNQSGDNLIYKGQGKSSVVFDWETKNIKEVVDTDGKKIPDEFVRETVGKNKLAKFSRNEGLDKIFSAWTKLSANDKLVYNSLNGFNKGAISQAELLNKINDLYQVKAERIYIDVDKKHFISGEGKKFDITLKGVKKMVEFLKRR